MINRASKRYYAMPDLTLLRFVVISLALLSSACSENQDLPAMTTEAQNFLASQPEPTFKKSEIIEHFNADSVITWQQALDSAKELHKQVEQFLESPSRQTLDSALLGWEQSHTQYLATAFYRLLGLPELHALSTSDTPPIHSAVVRIDQQPLILGYLDTVAGYPKSGLIHSEIPLNEQTLIQEHQLGDIAYVALGFHALKDLMEGDPALDNAPEARFSKNLAGSDPIIKRRRDYLALINQLLFKDISRSAEAWLTPAGVYSQRVTTMSEDELLARIRQAIKLEQVALKGLGETPDEHINADAITLRQNRVTRLASLLK